MKIRKQQSKGGLKIRAAGLGFFGFLLLCSPSALVAQPHSKAPQLLITCEISGTGGLGGTSSTEFDITLIEQSQPGPYSVYTGEAVYSVDPMNRVIRLNTKVGQVTGCSLVQESIELRVTDLSNNLILKALSHGDIHRKFGSPAAIVAQRPGDLAVCSTVFVNEPGSCAGPADLNNDGKVDGSDLSILLGSWTTEPQSQLDDAGLIDLIKVLHAESSGSKRAKLNSVVGQLNEKGIPVNVRYVRRLIKKSGLK